MVELKANTAAAGLVPLEIGQLTLQELEDAPVSMIAAGPEGAASLQAHFGSISTVEVVEAGAWTLLPFAPGQYLLRGQIPSDLSFDGCHMTEQSDAWVWLELHGHDAAAALARLVALDFSEAAFRPGFVAHAAINHMNGLIWRKAEDRFVLATFRSMAGTLVHELETAMHAIRARQEIVA